MGGVYPERAMSEGPLLKVQLVDLPAQPTPNQRTEAAPQKRCHDFATERVGRPAEDESADGHAEEYAKFRHGVGCDWPATGNAWKVTE